jgi:hypothetical protein
MRKIACCFGERREEMGNLMMGAMGLISTGPKVKKKAVP